jgi:hypothetical protein
MDQGGDMAANFIKISVVIDKQGWLRSAETNERIRCLKQRERERLPAAGTAFEYMLHPSLAATLPKLDIALRTAARDYTHVYDYERLCRIVPGSRRVIAGGTCVEVVFEPHPDHTTTHATVNATSVRPRPTDNDVECARETALGNGE